MKMYLWFLVVLAFVFGVIFAYKNDFDPQLARHEVLMLLAEWRHDVGTKDDELAKAFDALIGEAREASDQLNGNSSDEQRKWKTELDDLVEQVKNKKDDLEQVKGDIDGRVENVKQGYEDARDALEKFRNAFASIKSGMAGANDAIDGFREAVAD